MPSLENYHAQLLRLTVFPSSEKAMEQVPEWEEIVGNPPDQVTQQPKINILEEIGQFGQGSLTHRVVPGRIDWIYSPFFSDKKLPEGIAEIGFFSEAIEEFKSSMIKWMGKCDALKRIAFGATIFFPVDSHESAYKFLDKCIESVKLDPETSEFLYQINRRRPSKTLGEKLMINRLSKWRAIKFNLKINDLEVEESFACSIELDINNVPNEQIIIEKKFLTDLFVELIDLGTEIAVEGDIP
jgi:hypothetical protein